jgi:hypothetical protein
MAGGLPPSKGLDSEYQAREPTRWRRPDHPHALQVILVASPTACPPWQAKAGVGPVHLRLRPPAHRFERTERRGSHGHFGPQGLRRAGRSRKLFYFLRLGTVGLGGPGPRRTDGTGARRRQGARPITQKALQLLGQRRRPLI